MEEGIKQLGFLLAVAVMWVVVMLCMIFQFAQPDPAEAAEASKHKETPEPETAYAAETEAHRRKRLAYVARHVGTKDKVMAGHRQRWASMMERQELLNEQARRAE